MRLLRLHAGKRRYRLLSESGVAGRNRPHQPSNRAHPPEPPNHTGQQRLSQPKTCRCKPGSPLGRETRRQVKMRSNEVQKLLEQSGKKSQTGDETIREINHDLNQNTTNVRESPGSALAVCMAPSPCRWSGAAATPSRASGRRPPSRPRSCSRWREVRVNGAQHGSGARRKAACGSGVSKRWRPSGRRYVWRAAAARLALTSVGHWPT